MLAAPRAPTWRGSSTSPSRTRWRAPGSSRAGPMAAPKGGWSWRRSAAWRPIWASRTPCSPSPRPARARAPRWCATRSRWVPASIAGPRPTGSSSSTPRPRPPGATPTRAGTGGAIPAPSTPPGAERNWPRSIACSGPWRARPTRGPTAACVTRTGTLTHWQQGRAIACGWGCACAAGSRDPLGPVPRRRHAVRASPALLHGRALAALRSGRLGFARARPGIRSCMCGWPPSCKGFLAWCWVSLAVMCPALGAVLS